MVANQACVLAAGLLLAGCPASSEDVRPPDDLFFFPSALAISPDEGTLFVANGNADLRYSSGSLLAIEIDAIATVLEQWRGGAGSGPAECEPDRTFGHTLVCPTAVVHSTGSAVRIGNFASEIGVQVLTGGADGVAAGDLRLFLPVRGDPSVTWVDFDSATRKLRCTGSSSSSFPVCDNEHRVTRLRDDVELPTLISEPFGIHVDSSNGYAVVSHLTAGSVSLVDAPPDGAQPMLADAMSFLFDANSQGARGAVGVAGRRPGSADDLVYVTSSTDEHVQTLYAHRAAGGPAGAGVPQLVRSEQIRLAFAGGDNARGIAFSDDGARAHIVNRSPPMLQTFDTSLTPAGLPRNQLVSVTELCSKGAQLAAGDVGRGGRVYATCFLDGQVWSVNPITATVEAMTNVGSGPHGVVLAPGRKLLFVANYLEDSLVVVDVAPGSVTENRVVLRLGGQ